MSMIMQSSKVKFHIQSNVLHDYLLACEIFTVKTLASKTDNVIV